ncbi:hypothetical protein ACOMHN_005048 [Nucella lapillus]
MSLRHVRRIPHPGRGGSSRTRRGNMHFGLGSSTNTLTGLSPSGRENMDPIAELLSQLSSVRSRAAAAQSVSSQLQQLEMQLQSTRQQLERMPRRQGEVSKVLTGTATAPIANPESGLTSSQSSSASESQYLLTKMIEENQMSTKANCSEPDRLEKNVFVQELLLSTMTEQLRLASLAEDPDNLLESLSLPQSKLQSSQSLSVAGVAVIGTESSTTGTDDARAGRVTIVEAPCKSKSLAGSSSVAASGKSSSTSPTPGSSSRPSPRATSPLGATSQPEGRSVAMATIAASESGAAGSLSPRDANRLNPAAAKRGMLKHVSASRGGATDMDPPPH